MAENLRAFGLFVFICRLIIQQKNLSKPQHHIIETNILSSWCGCSVTALVYSSDVIFSCVSDSRKLHRFENIEYLSIESFLINDFCFRSKFFFSSRSRSKQKVPCDNFQSSGCPYFIIFEAQEWQKQNNRY